MTDSAERAYDRRRSIDKAIPANFEAEEAVLGALLIDTEAVARVDSFLKPTDFYREANGLIYSARLDLHERREPGDFVTLVDELARRGHLERVGGPAYLTSLINAVPTAVHVEHYAHIVERCGIMRRLIEAAGHIAGIGYDNPNDVDAALDQAEQTLFAISQRRVSQDFMSIRDALRDYFEQIDYLHQHKGEIVGVPTGFHDLDVLTGGMHASDLIIIAGRPAVGKTAFALSLARNTAVRFKQPVALFSLEMSVEQLTQRLLCMEAAVDSQRLRSGFIDELEWRRIGEAFGVLSEAPIFIDDTAAISLVEMRMKARRLKAEHDIKLVVVDYLQLMQGRGLENRVQEVSEISRGLKALARELGVPVIALSQLSRAIESRQDHRPMLSDLRESGCLAGDTLIIDPTTGRRARMDSLVGREGAAVYALDDRLRLARRQVSRAFCSGVKQLFEVRLASGRRIKATSNHPFRTVDGWRALEELGAGDRVATARRLPEPLAPTTMRESELVLLAHLLGDGCVVPRQPIHYTSADPACVEAVAAAARESFGIEARIVPQRTWQHVYLPSPTPLTHGKSHPITAWLRRLGTGPARSWEKEIPEAIFALPTGQLALFLRHLWATDGNLTRARHTRAAIYYASTSRVLAEGVQHLLLRLGIVARLKTVRKAGYRACYHLHIYGATDQARFLREIGCFGRRGEVAGELLAELETVRPNPNVDVIPKEIWSEVGRAKDAAGLTWRGVATGLGMAYSGSTLFRAGLSRSRLTRVAAVVGSDDLADLAASDVYWDEIVEVSPLGEEPAYDLTVPEAHNFLANGCYVHNSIEQDSDIVMFVHREELYNPQTDKKNIADLIIAKHRNGPIGQISMRFFPSQTRFSDLEIYRQTDD